MRSEYLGDNMSYTQLGYPVVSTTNMALQTSVPAARSSPKSPPGSPCCETGRPVMTDPVTGNTVCSCQYNPPTPTIYPGYPRVPGLPEALYNQAAVAAQLQFAAAAAGSEHTALYGGLANPGATSPYEFKGLPTAAAGLYPYDPSALAAYPYAAGFLDPNARRKNATRESTQTLKAWLTEHKKNPYPTKGEKIMLAIITKMTLTQVSTWFANARRRLKKENKMTWEPRNRMDEDDDDDVTGSDVEEGERKDGEEENISVDSDDDDPPSLLRHNPLTSSIADLAASRASLLNSLAASQLASRPPQAPDAGGDGDRTTRPATTSAQNTTDSQNNTPQKPKIWSMAEIATSSSNNNKTDSSEDSREDSSPLSVHQLNSKMPSMISQGLHPAWRGAHPYLHPHLAQRLASFPPTHQYTNHRLPVTSLPQHLLRHGADSANRSSAFSPPANSALTSHPSTQAQRNA